MGVIAEDVVVASGAESLEEALRRAADSCVPEPPRASRVAWLRGIADALGDAADELIEIAETETNLSRERLANELTRTRRQFILSADAVAEGACFEISIDHEVSGPGLPPSPDIRRRLRGIGPVLIFPAGNFPLAFGVAGTDTAAALAAGCAVIVKAYSAYPELSRRTGDVVAHALAANDAPDGLFQLVETQADALAVLRHPFTRAASFTGSTRVGRFLFDIAMSRPDPIPFYGELGGVNPCFILPSALEHGIEELVEGFVGSFTFGVGQLCTKPGILVAPAGHGIAQALVERAAGVTPALMLTIRTQQSYLSRIAEMRQTWEEATADHRELDAGASEEHALRAIRPSLFVTNISNARECSAQLFEETFGPAAVLVEYRNDQFEEVQQFAREIPGQLTASIHASAADHETSRLLETLETRAGRVLWNTWPTGVPVGWSTHHGGPWPATTASLFSSVGPTSIRRFLTPVSYQNMPAALLRQDLRDHADPTVRRVDGELIVDGSRTACE